MQDIFKYIDEHLNESIASLTELCKLPTVSAQKQAIGETAEHVVGCCGRWGSRRRCCRRRAAGRRRSRSCSRSCAGKSPKTLLFYDHYDVQPPEPLELWTSPPFQPTLRDGKLYGRGVSDNKGNIAARVAAIKAWREVRGELPCSLKFCIEGDEEIGSPHMEEFVEEHRELLSADACLWEGGGVTWEGLPMVTLGVKGLLYVELTCETINRDAHSSYGTVLPNAAWRLVWALSTIKSPDERVQIEGFYDDVRPPTPEERAAIEAMPQEEAETLKSFGIEKALTGVTRRRLHRAAPVRADGDDRRAVVGVRGRGAEDGAAGEGDGEDGLPPRAGPGPGRHHGEAAAAPGLARLRRHRDQEPRRRAAGADAGDGPARRRDAGGDPRRLRQRSVHRAGDGGHGAAVPVRRDARPADGRLRDRLPGRAHPRAGREHPRGGFPAGDEGDCGADWAVWGGLAARPAAANEASNLASGSDCQRIGCERISGCSSRERRIAAGWRAMRRQTSHHEAHRPSS